MDYAFLEQVSLNFLFFNRYQFSFRMSSAPKAEPIPQPPQTRKRGILPPPDPANVTTEPLSKPHSKGNTGRSTPSQKPQNENRPPQLTNDQASTGSSDIPSRKRKNDEQSKVHPYILKFDRQEAKLKEILENMYTLALNDLLVCNRDSGVNDYDMSLQFATRLDALSKSLIVLSNECTTKATEVREKIESAKDRKDHLQECFYVGDVLKPSQMCAKLKKT